MPSRYIQLPPNAGTKRDTPRILIERTLALIKGHYQEIESILDYTCRLTNSGN